MTYIKGGTMSAQIRESIDNVSAYEHRDISKTVGETTVFN